MTSRGRVANTTTMNVSLAIAAVLLSAPSAISQTATSTPTSGAPWNGPPDVVIPRVHVDASATGANDGRSWDDAFTDLQVALRGTTQGEIWVAAGTYHAGLAGEQQATFQLKSGVALYGGFAGTENILSQRDLTANISVLSGDIDQNDTYGTGLNWWQFAWTGGAGNSYHIVTGTGTDSTAWLDGFTILAGIGFGSPIAGGAGLVVDGGSPTLNNCTFQYNAVGYGSSAYLRDCGSVFRNCVIRDGYTCNCGAGGWTSGILILGSSVVDFVDCDFLNHYYVSSQSQGRGAALSIDIGSASTLIGCRFIGNQTGNFYPIGGGTAYGAGIHALGSVTIDSSEFVDNFAHAGAAVTAWGDLAITNSLFARNLAVSHPNGSGFDDGGFGAAVVTVGTGNHTIDVVDSTFVDNNSDKGAGLALYGSSVAQLHNNIIYHNFADPPAPGEDLVWILKQNIVGNYDVTYSCIEALLQTEPGEDPPDPANFPGCIDTLPQFVSVPGQDYHLSAISPCIDAADNTFVPAGLLADLDGLLRFHDDPNTPDTGVGPAPVVDMGVYEFGSSAPLMWTGGGPTQAGAVPPRRGAPMGGGYRLPRQRTGQLPAASVSGPLLRRTK